MKIEEVMKRWRGRIVGATRLALSVEGLARVLDHLIRCIGEAW